MHPDTSLKENVTHGTKENPITGIHFTTGKHTAYPDHFFVDRHWHHMVEILRIVKGRYKIEINLEDYYLNTGDICFLNSGDLHQITGLEGDTIHDVAIFDPRILGFSYTDELEETVIAPLLKHERIFPHILSPSHPEYSLVDSLVRPLTQRAASKDTGWYVFCKLTLLELTALMARRQLLLPADTMLSAPDKQKIDRYKKLISYMEAHYQEPVTLNELAKIIPCNSQYLCRFFKEITGTSPIQYLIVCRMEHACTLLAETTRPILDISLDCGFDNVSYFIRKFKQLKGCTPKEYRKKATSNMLLETHKSPAP